MHVFISVLSNFQNILLSALLLISKHKNTPNPPKHLIVRPETLNLLNGKKKERKKRHFKIQT